MAKELPYFRFYAGEWMTGDITLLPMDVQGVFTNVCAFYWSRDCGLSLAKLRRKFANYADAIDMILDEQIITTDGENIVISFLDEQREMLLNKSVALSRAGRKGGLIKAKARLKPGSSYKDKDKDKDKDIVRRNAFTPPKIDEVKDYCLERKNSVSPTKFIDHYISNGWMVGCNKMKDWKAAVRKWEGSDFGPEAKVPKMHDRTKTEGAPKDYGIPTETSKPMPETFKAKFGIV